MSAPDRNPKKLGIAVAFERIAVAAELSERHHSSLLATARTVSICAADAEDSVQRALEIFIRKGPVGTGDRPLGWLRVVTRNEAIAVRKRRERLLAGSDRTGQPIARVPAGGLEPPCDRSGPAERMIEADRWAEAAARLARLKQDQRRAIGLQAAGCSYAEIAAICGWTYTKVNRCISEGRATLAPLAADPVY